MNDRQIRLSASTVTQSRSGPLYMQHALRRCEMIVNGHKHADCLWRRSLLQPRMSAIGAERKCRHRSLLASRLLSHCAALVTAAEPKLCRRTANGKDLLSGIDGCTPREDHWAVKRQAETAPRRSE